MQFVTTKYYENLADRFWQAYEPINFLYLPETSNKRLLKDKVNRRCRFCGSGISTTTFNKDAHFFPESLGNKTLFSDFECDNCNEIFGTYEDQLGKFFEIERPLNKIRGKKKYPGYKAPDKEIKIKVNHIQNEKVVEIERYDVENQLIIFDEKYHTWTIRMRRNPIVPNKIYKYLLKLALSLMPEQNVDANYSIALNFILNKLPNPIKKCQTIGYMLPISICYTPHAYLFAKKDPNENIPTHVLSFYYLNYILSIPLLLHNTDLMHYNDKIGIIDYPPFFQDFDDAVNCEIKPFGIDFSSEQNEKLEDYELCFRIDENQWKTRAGFVLNSKEFIDGNLFNPNEIVRIMLTGDDFDLLKTINTR